MQDVNGQNPIGKNEKSAIKYYFTALLSIVYLM